MFRADKRSQANVALNLQPKQSTEETDPAQNSKVRKTNESAVVASNNSLMQMIRKEVAEEKASEKDTNVEEKPANVDADETSATKIKANAEAMDITPVTSPTKQNVTKAEEAHAMEEEDDDDGQVHIVSRIGHISIHLNLVYSFAYLSRGNRLAGRTKCTPLHSRFSQGHHLEGARLLL